MNTMLPKRIKFIIITGIVSVFLGITIWWILINTMNSASHKESLTIAEASQPVFALLYIADAKGYFEEEGLDVTYNTFTSGRDALNSAIKGESDLATVYETPVIIRSYEGARLSVISTLHYSTRNTALVVFNEKGRFTGKDLADKRFGVPKNTNAEFFLYLYLTNKGIDVSKVTIVDVNPEDMIDTLKNKTVNAIAVWNPYLYNVISTFNNNQLSVFYSNVYTELSVLAGRREIIMQKQEAMKRLLKAIIKAEQFKEDNEEEAKKIVIKRLSNQPEEAIRGVWDAFSAKVLLNNVLLTVLEHEAEWFRDSGKYKTSSPNFSEIVFPDLLNELRPDSVTIF